MKFTEKTIGVLRNFANINKNIELHEGAVIRTVSPSKTIMGKALVDNEFPRDVGIKELNRFLNVVTLFDDADVDFKDSNAVISSGPSKVRYSYSDPSVLAVAKKKDLNVDDYFITIHISHEILTAVDKARKTLGLSDISIEGDGSKLWLKSIDSSGSTADEFSLELGETDRKFKAVIKAENMELLPSSYDVSVSPKGITYWKGDGIEYWIVLVANKSEF
jgi:hypothetical protein